MIQSPEALSEPRLLRFTRAEHVVHRTVAGLTLVCMLTAAVLYNAPVAVEIGHRRIVKTIHVVCGYSLPVPIVVGFAFAAYRSDMRRLNRFSRADWKWLRSRTRRGGSIVVGKFNAGQKLNAALSGGAIAVLLGTGTLMYFPSLVRLAWRTGATFVHDWFALALGLLVIGHIRFATKDPESRVGMRTGSVSAQWARKHHSAWAAEQQSRAAVNANGQCTDREAQVNGASDPSRAEPDQGPPT